MFTLDLGSSLIPVSGDVGTGTFQPGDVRPADFKRISRQRLDSLGELTGLSSTASDVLDELGYTLSVSTDVLRLRTAPVRVVGQALTIRYLPERRSASHAELRRSQSKLTHHAAFAMAQRGDVAVIEVGGMPGVSVLGGIGAQSASTAGLAGCIVDGAVRDLEQIQALGLPVWARTLTPRTGKWRVEAVAINAPIACAGVQVHAGDLVIADETGICFVPIEVAEAAIDRILEVTRQEAEQLASSPPRPPAG
jgi:4-hydroxy-4-methyl-2-oxoglutarate aldolase